MAHSNSAKKRIRQNADARARNRWRMGSMRTSIKDLGDKLLHGTPAEATEAFKAACKQIDRTAAKGVIHKNQAARRKSRLAARLKAKVDGKPQPGHKPVSVKAAAPKAAAAPAKVGAPAKAPAAKPAPKPAPKAGR